MKKTQPAGGCLGTLFALLVVLYVVFGMLWMFIKEHIGLIAIAAIIIGVLWYRSKMNKKGLFEQITSEENSQRFFVLPDGYYLDLWSAKPDLEDDNFAEYLAYRKLKLNNEDCVEIFCVYIEDKGESVEIARISSIVYSLEFYNKLDVKDQSYLHALNKISKNRTDYMFTDNTIAEYFGEDYKYFMKRAEDAVNLPGFKEQAFNFNKFEQDKKDIYTRFK